MMPHMLMRFIFALKPVSPPPRMMPGQAVGVFGQGAAEGRKDGAAQQEDRKSRAQSDG